MNQQLTDNRLVLLTAQTGWFVGCTLSDMQHTYIISFKSCLVDQCVVIDLGTNVV